MRSQRLLDIPKHNIAKLDARPERKGEQEVGTLGRSWRGNDNGSDGFGPRSRGPRRDRSCKARHSSLTQAAQLQLLPCVHCHHSPCLFSASPTAARIWRRPGPRPGPRGNPRTSTTKLRQFRTPPPISLVSRITKLSLCSVVSCRHGRHTEPHLPHSLMLPPLPFRRNKTLYMFILLTAGLA
ncbi:hypothetical protein CMEL01_02271 [Colletotrichum melonis]|uniref:Uncharacterized protein n=1 Tax=Colletotrichum melonis TaxID=1209925 RepID=A0AAI9UKW7_9PEZI|nr:hypothetical protein CMEL01_02271 [Colletotrichum melonis]